MRILSALPTGFVVDVATLWGLGRNCFAPGTMGSLAGIAWYIIGFWHMPSSQFILTLVLSVIVGVLFCGEAEYRLREKDASCIILDEFCAMPLCFWHIEQFSEVPLWKIIICGFLLFRFFDILKPFGIRALQRFPRGIGIMIDDIVAALATCVVLHIIIKKFLIPES